MERVWLLAPGYADRFAELVSGPDLHADRFVFELTESAWTTDAAQARTAIAKLRAVGSSVALDDFGAGYTSLSGLRQLDVDVIKVDGSLLVGVPADSAATEVLRAVLGLARACRASVVAEGVASEEQAELLRSWGVTHMQGSLFGHPMTPDHLATLLHRHRLDVPPPSRGVGVPASSVQTVGRQLA